MNWKWNLSLNASAIKSTEHISIIEHFPQSLRETAFSEVKEFTQGNFWQMNCQNGLQWFYSITANWKVFMSRNSDKMQLNVFTMSSIVDNVFYCLLKYWKVLITSFHFVIITSLNNFHILFNGCRTTVINGMLLNFHQKSIILLIWIWAFCPPNTILKGFNVTCQTCKLVNLFKRLVMSIILRRNGNKLSTQKQ